MARAYSLDLRERVVACVAAGATCRAVAARFAVSVASVVKWSQRYRATGSPAAKRMGGRAFVLAGERDWLLARLQERPDITLHDLLFELRARGKVVSCGALWNFLHVQGLRYKKNSPRQRARAA